MFIYVCMYVRTTHLGDADGTTRRVSPEVRMHICVYIVTHTYICLYICMYVRTTHLGDADGTTRRVSPEVRIHICVYIVTHTYTCLYIYVYVYEDDALGCR